MRAYEYENEEAEVAQDALDAIGVLYWHLDADNYAEEGTLDQIRAERDYKNSDEICVSREGMGDQFEAKTAMFFEEHLHEDEEIRFVLDGEGYFDVRDKEDKWIRIHVTKGDMIVLPAGIYHRFALTDSAYIKAMRLFKDEPKWTPCNRDVPETDALPARGEYLAAFAGGAKRKAEEEPAAAAEEGDKSAEPSPAKVARAEA